MLPKRFHAPGDNGGEYYRPAVISSNLF